MSNETRKLPTRPGWWLVESTNDYEPEILTAMVFGDGFCRCYGDHKNWHVDSGWLTWLAPIPGPEVLAALAEYGDALAESLDDGMRGSRREGQAWDVLRSAILAERDGDA